MAQYNKPGFAQSAEEKIRAREAARRQLLEPRGSLNGDSFGTYVLAQQRKTPASIVAYKNMAQLIRDSLDPIDITLDKEDRQVTYNRNQTKILAPLYLAAHPQQIEINDHKPNLSDSVRKELENLLSELNFKSLRDEKAPSLISNLRTVIESADNLPGFWNWVDSATLAKGNAR